jgi:tetratricopeptide (TPR) repeat protein
VAHQLSRIGTNPVSGEDRCNNQPQRARSSTLISSIVFLTIVWLAILPGTNAQSGAPQTGVAQSPPPSQPAPRAARNDAPITTVTVDASEAMFTTMCALLASGFESNVSAESWHPLRTQLRDRMQHQQGPAVDAIREFYKQHVTADPGETLSRYLWFGLVAGPAPNFKPTMRREDLPPEVLAIEGFNELLSKYYQEQHIGQLWRQIQPSYNREIEHMHEAVSQIVFIATGYLRSIAQPSDPRTFTIVVEPLVGRITNVRNFGDHYAIVLSGAEDVPIDVVRHAYLHFLLDPLPLRYAHVVAVKRPLFQKAAAAPRLAPDLKDDFPSYFAECTVRAVELKLKKMSPGERDAALERNDTDGYVLVRPLFNSLQKFEGSEPSMALFFPDMVRSIDATAELRRVNELHFASADQHRKSNELASEEVARRRAALPDTVPNDPEAIAALTEGERRISEKNPRAAEASFQKVIAKYPDQTRAWYGLGLVAMLDHDGARAKDIFGRLTAGEHAATPDPMVLAWSHIYLGRIYDGEGQPRRAEAEYQAALTVLGSPEQARQAAKKGLDDASKEKSVERP